MILVLKIVNTHGVRGEVKALYYADGPDFFARVKTLYDKDGAAYVISGVREHKGALIVKIEGSDDIESADKLRNAELFARREDMPRLPEGRFYVVDLIGLTVVLPDGKTLGTVKDVFAGGGGSLIEVKRENGRAVLIPYVDEFVKEVSLEDGKMLITPTEGLIDDEV